MNHLHMAGTDNQNAGLCSSYESTNTTANSPSRAARECYYAKDWHLIIILLLENEGAIATVQVVLDMHKQVSTRQSTNKHVIYPKFKTL